MPMTEIVLRAGGWSAVLLPEQGAAFARLDHGGVDVLAPLPTGANPNATPAGAFWMAPWTNRMDGGELGPGWQVPITEAARNTAIHGFSRDRPWDVVSASESHVRLEQTVVALPYSYRVRLTVRIAPEGLGIAFIVTNLGDEAAPVGLGWHPWFARREGQRVTFAAEHQLIADARLLPADAVASPGFADADVTSLMGTDAHFTGWNGRFLLEDAALRLEMRAGGAWARNLQLYVPLPSPVICLEPVSHIPNAPNCPELAPLGPLLPLAPGASRRAWLRLANLP